jgi:hypothetical protein
MTPIESRASWRIYGTAKDAARAQGLCRVCATETAFAIVEAAMGKGREVKLCKTCERNQRKDKTA